MNEGRADFELLREFVRQGNQSAFAALVRRHLDLVYATALRKTEDTGAAQEVAQNVFVALARKAWQFGPEDSLAAWLHRTALLESKDWLRGELRRRRREQAAAELGTTMKAPDEQSALRALVPLLDEALLALREKDRTALLLRYYEKQSLRELGASFGVGEDAAQKRVAGALEQLSRFFQGRGFKTASVAMTAAALQHTATVASATTASVIIQGALQSAPPALLGLTSILARLTSLSKPQVVTLCLAVVALPLSWQWNEHRDAVATAARVRADLDSIRLEQTRIETEIQQLTETAERLNASVAKAAEFQTQKAEAARKLEAWKARIRGLLTAEEYRWPEDLPFVRIPKSAASKLDVSMPLTPPGVIKPAARELLGLLPEERAAVEDQLHNYFGGINQLIEGSIYETNQPAGPRPPSSAIASTIFHVPALGEAAKESAGRLMSELKALLGEQRWPLIESQLSPTGTHTLERVLGLDTDHEPQEAFVWIKPNEKGELAVGDQKEFIQRRWRAPGVCFV
jgi:RNA polymerase sigma factor (sigma-70 family)